MITMSRPPAAVAGPSAAAPGHHSARSRLAASAVLAAVLLAIAGAVVAGPGGMVSADEGAVLGQAQIRAETGGYATEYWARAADPGGRWFPIHNSTHHGERWFLFTKKPAYVELVAVAGTAGRAGTVLVLVHVLGVVMAALGAALVTRRVAPRLEIPTFWATAIGSPLVVDGSWVIAHGPAAAAAGVVAVGVAQWWRDERSRGLLLVAAWLVAASLLRNEATLLGLAITTGAAVSLRTRRHRLRARGLALTALGATVGGVCVATAWQRAVEGGSDAGLYRVSEDLGFLAARSHALWNTLFSPQAPGGPTSGWLVLAAAGFLAVGWSSFSIRRGWTVASTALAVVALVARLVLDGFLVPGLLTAWPVGLAGLVVALPRWRRALDDDLVALLGRVSVLMVVAILATTYSTGGTGDWGARYLHLAMPFMTPVAVIALARRVRARPNLRPGIAGLAVAAVLLASIALVGFRAGARNAAMLAEIVSWVNGPASCSPDAIIVTTSPSLGRFAYDEALEHPMLFIDPSTDIESSARDVAAAFPGERFAVIAPRGDVERIDVGIAARRRVPATTSAEEVAKAPQWSYPGRCTLGSGRI